MEASDLLERLIASTDDALIVANTRGRITVFNKAAQDLLGYTEREALGVAHAADLYADPRDARRLALELERSDPEPTRQDRVRMRTHIGEAIPTRFVGWQLRDKNGTVIGTAALYRDLRKYEAMAIQIGAFTNEVLVQEAAATTKLVAGGAAHELNQPLTSVMGMLELLLLRKGLDTDVTERLDRAYGQLERMAETVRRLSEVRQPQSRKYIDDTDILDLESDR